MTQIVLTDTFDAPRQSVWKPIADVHGHGRFTELIKTKKDGEQRRIQIGDYDMIDGVVASTANEELTVAAKEFHDAPFKHFVATFRLAGPEEGPTSVAIAIDFSAGLASFAAKGTVEKAFRELLQNVGKIAVADSPVTVTA